MREQRVWALPPLVPYGSLAPWLSRRTCSGSKANSRDPGISPRWIWPASLMLATRSSNSSFFIGVATRRPFGDTTSVARREDRESAGASLDGIEMQWKPLRTLDRFDREIDVEIRPAHVIGSRPANVQYLADRRISKPGELSKVDEKLSPSQIQPEAVPGNTGDLNLSDAGASALQFRQCRRSRIRRIFLTSRSATP